jgi:D-3-phosphoglycerate dehydrogenase
MRVFLRADLLCYEQAAFASALDRRGHILVDDDAEVIVTSGNTLVENDLARHSHLTRVVRFARGRSDEQAERSLLDARSIELTMISGVSASSTAEHALAMIIAALRRLPQSTAALLDGRWCPSDISGSGLPDFADVTVGLVGMGSVARHLAALLRALDMNVLSTRRTLLQVQPDIDELISRCDVICLVSRTTADEQPLLTRERIASLRPGTIIVNLGSGGDVNIEALREAVATRAIVVALDVFPGEPADLSSFAPYAGNVILSPHIAGRSRATAGLMAEAVASAIDARPVPAIECACAGFAVTSRLVARTSDGALRGATILVPRRLPHLEHAASRTGAAVVSATGDHVAVMREGTVLRVDPLCLRSFAHIVVRWPSDFSTWESLLPRHARGSLPGRRLFIERYDDEGRRIAQRARELGLRPIVVEDDGPRRIDAILDGFSTVSSYDAKSRDLVVTRQRSVAGVPSGLADEETAATLAVLIAGIDLERADALFASAFIAAREGSAP